MKHPKVQSAMAVDDHILVIEFDNKQKKKYDITPLLEKEMFFSPEKSCLVQICKGRSGGLCCSLGQSHRS